MCRAEAHRLYAKKPIFDKLGVQLFAVLHEHIEAEVFSKFISTTCYFKGTIFLGYFTFICMM